MKKRKGKLNRLSFVKPKFQYQIFLSLVVPVEMWVKLSLFRSHRFTFFLSLLWVYILLRSLDLCSPQHWIIRMPNFVKFDSQPFHPDTYRGPEADLDEAEQAESLRERSMSIKLEVENTIRWRWAVGEDGKKVRDLC